jgi:hypothetical protein
MNYMLWEIRGVTKQLQLLKLKLSYNHAGKLGCPTNKSGKVIAEKEKKCDVVLWGDCAVNSVMARRKHSSK